MTHIRQAGITLMAIALVTLAIVGVLRLTHHYATCHAVQPVYAGTVRTGTWYATLRAGQSVTLPDGDTLTCTARGAYVH